MNSRTVYPEQISLDLPALEMISQHITLPAQRVPEASKRNHALPIDCKQEGLRNEKGWTIA